MQADQNNTFSEAAFEQLFREHFKGLCVFAMRYVKDVETAKELVHEAFVSLWEKRHSIDTSKPVKSYLTTAVYNKCLNYLRDNKKFNREMAITDGLVPMSEPDSSVQIAGRELEEKIKMAIAELPEKCREVFVLNRFGQLKYMEIADKLGISVKTVETQMSKALQHMRSRLIDYISFLWMILKFF